MAIGIDWVSVIILLAAYGFAQIRSIPVRIRYGVFAAAAAAIALYKFRQGTTGPNLIFVLLAGFLAIYYGVKAIQAGRR